MKETTALRKELNRDLEKRRHVLMTLNQEKERMESLKRKEEDIILAQMKLQELAQAVQAESHHQIAKIVSKCLSTVFDEPYRLKIEFVRQRGKTEAKLIYVKNGREEDPLQTSGGVLDISSLGLRVSQLMLSSPQARKILILDEPMTGVDARNMHKAAALIETLSHEMGIQIILVTHNESLEVGKVIRL